MTNIKNCKTPKTCKAETDYGTGVTECPCGVIGWLAKNGELYNQPMTSCKTCGKVRDNSYGCYC